MIFCQTISLPEGKLVTNQPARARVAHFVESELAIERSSNIGVSTDRHFELQYPLVICYCLAIEAMAIERHSD